MIRTVPCAVFLLLIAVTAAVTAQAPDYGMLEGSPYDPAVDPNPDLFISSWKNSMPRHSHGSLVERDIFTANRSDPLKPHRKGAVLTSVNRFSHASLEALASTVPVILRDEQLIFYIDSGKGVLSAGKQTADLHEGVGFIMPPGIEYTMKNTGDTPLTMYIISEPIPEGFKPNTTVVVHDENTLPFRGSNGHWTHIDKPFFTGEDGLAVLVGMNPVRYDPMTMGQPHSHGVGVEEIWFALEGDITLLLGKQLRKLPVGSAYKIPPDGKTPHSNINVSDKPIKLFWFMMNVPTEEIPYSQLTSKPYDPETEPNIDMFIRSWKESMPRHTHGSLLERDILLKGNGDTVNPPARGAALKYVNRFTHASLMAHHTTIPETLKGEQEIFYVLSGTGTISAGNVTESLSAGIAVLMPENLEFSMTNTGGEPLDMYLISEPVPDGFRPNENMHVVDVNALPFYISDGHWIGVAKAVFGTADGLGTLESVQVVSFSPMTFFHPHSHVEGTEEVWTGMYDGSYFLMGKQIRYQPSDTAYMIPTDGRTPHANFNVSDDPVKLFYFARYGDHEVRK
ncbi:cupin domain-containing protein [Candidatus Latescibacterota bacterium]